MKTIARSAGQLALTILACLCYVGGSILLAGKGVIERINGTAQGGS